MAQYWSFKDEIHTMFDTVTHTEKEYAPEGRIFIRERELTQAENTVADSVVAATVAQTNRTTIESQALTALDTNKAFLALASPSNAQVLAQTRALTRQNNGIIRLLLNRLDGTD